MFDSREPQIGQTLQLMDESIDRKRHWSGLDQHTDALLNQAKNSTIVISTYWQTTPTTDFATTDLLTHCHHILLKTMRIINVTLPDPNTGHLQRWLKTAFHFITKGEFEQQIKRLVELANSMPERRTEPPKTENFTKSSPRSVVMAIPQIEIQSPETNDRSSTSSPDPVKSDPLSISASKIPPSRGEKLQKLDGILMDRENTHETWDLRQTLGRVVQSKDLTNKVISVKREDAADIEDLIWEALELGDVSDKDELSERLSSLLRKLTRRTGVFPRRLYVEGVKVKGIHPIYGGGLSDIYLGNHEGKDVAVKVLRIFGAEEEAFYGLCNEVLHWQRLRHPNILPLLGITHELFGSRLSIVSPWMKHGNVMRYLENNPNADRRALLRDTANGLAYLHGLTPTLVHGDVKGANIVVDAAGKACLTDFGLISFTSNSKFNTSFNIGPQCGTVRWMAPELLMDELGGDQESTPQSDVYAFGMTVLEILTGNYPWHELPRDHMVIVLVCRDERPSRPMDQAVTDEMWKLIQHCWRSRPTERPTIGEVLHRLELRAPQSD